MEAEVPLHKGVHLEQENSRTPRVSHPHFVEVPPPDLSQGRFEVSSFDCVAWDPPLLVPHRRPPIAPWNK